MGLFQSKSVQPVQPLQPIIFAPKILLNFPKITKQETPEEKDDRLKHAAIIFDSKKVKHHIEEQLR
jgi:hypothetical protein